MGSTPRAHLAYGYDLGNNEDFKAAERHGYGDPNLAWLDRYAGHWEFIGEADKLLGASECRIASSGAEESEGWLLVVAASERSVEWDEAMPLDVNDLAAKESSGDWDIKLAAALTALGITPTQDGPKWLVYPTYG